MKPEEIMLQERIKKLNELREMDINPYAYSFNQTDHSKEILEKFSKLKNEEKTKTKVSIAGRIILLRKMGKASFLHIQDESGKIQVYIRQDDVGEEQYKMFKKLDIGDIIGVEGIVFKTKMGEVTIYTQKMTLLTKALYSLPEKHHGLQDKETRYRQRYLDFIVNPETKEIFKKRHLILKYTREFLEKKRYIEVEIPLLQTQYGGANAKPFITHINAWNMDMYLSISPELYLKRLIVGGFENVYTICKNFRNESVDKSHNPEFTMMECYKAYEDYNFVIKLVEDLFEYVCKKVNGTTKIKYGKYILDFKAPWKKMTMKEAIKKYANLDIDKLSEKDLIKELEKRKIEYKKGPKGKLVENLFEGTVEEHLIQPTHIIDHPKESTPLCKLHRKNPELIERFESYILGIEVTNGYSELNNPELQRKLLEEQAKELRAGSEESHPMDEDFIRAIEQGLPPTAGVGIGIDRMVMFLTGAESIRDIIAFPTMKPIEKE